MRLTLKTINDELRRLGHDVHLEKGDGYFSFLKCDAHNWLDRTVHVPKVSSLTLKQWIGEFERLKKLNDKLASRRGPIERVAEPKIAVQTVPKKAGVNVPNFTLLKWSQLALSLRGSTPESSHIRFPFTA